VNHNLYALLESSFPAQRDAIAIEAPGVGNYTWDDLARGSARIANALAGLKLPEGARVAAYVEKSVEALMLYLATLRAGYVYLPLNTAYQSAEIDYFLGDAEPSLVVCASKNLAWVRDCAKRAGTRHVLTLDDDRTGSLLDAAMRVSDQAPIARRAADDLATILYTSGTTGRSKGAMLTHGNLAANAQVLHRHWGWRSDDVLLHMLPIFHVHGLFVASHGALLAGARMIWLPKLDARAALELLPRCTVMMGVPTYYTRLLAEPALDRKACANVRLFI
jgi:malonyl-CoA/methylmalonyl-CoA synthetase